MIKLYSIAISQFWKVFFCFFQKIFKFFFTFEQGLSENVDKDAQLVNHLTKHRQHDVTECRAVERGACDCEKHGVESRAPRAGAQPQQKKPREYNQRIDEIQRRPSECAAFCARCAQRVEYQPECKAQHQRQRREHRLIRHRGLHPKSFAQKPSPRCGVSA